MAFKVLIGDGPAAGYCYVTMCAPDRKIAIAPTPREDEYSPFKWMRVLLEGEPWPNQHTYERGALPDPVVAAQLDDEDDFVVDYHLVDA